MAAFSCMLGWLTIDLDPSGIIIFAMSCTSFPRKKKSLVLNDLSHFHSLRGSHDFIFLSITLFLSYDNIWKHILCDWKSLRLKSRYFEDIWMLPFTFSWPYNDASMVQDKLYHLLYNFEFWLVYIHQNLVISSSLCLFVLWKKIKLYSLPNWKYI